MMRTLTFSVCNWSAWSDSLNGREAWRQWAQGRPVTVEAAEPDVSWVPAMQRRRLSRMSRMMFKVANDCLEMEAEPPLCVFASRHGELTRTLKILQAIAAEQDVSPTDFSMSVHNTGLGLFSIFTGNREPSSMVVAGEDTFAAALLEAHTYLRRFPARQVLLVYADEPVPAPLSSDDGLPHEAQSVALLLGHGEESLALCYQGQRRANRQSRNLAEAFMQFYLGEESQLRLCTRRGCWQWSKPG